MRLITVHITGEDYEQCVEAAEGLRGSDNKPPSQWQKGLVNCNADPRRAERIGNLGELAVRTVFDLDPSPIFKYRPKGDPGWDVHINGKKIEVKTSGVGTRDKHGVGFVKAKNSKGRDFPLRADAYVFCYLLDDNREAGTATVVCAGWVSKEDIEALELKPAKVGSHFNKEVPYEAMRSIASLVEVEG